MKNLFSAPTNGHHYLKPLEDPFRWVVAVFGKDGAPQAIIRANKASLKTYYPIRFNGKGEPTPLWANYLFIEFVETVTIDLCRDVPKFIQIISAHDDEGLLRPILVRRGAIQESLRLVTMGKFDDKAPKRNFYGKGTVARVIDGNFIDKRVTLEIDVHPHMSGMTKVPVDIGGIKAKIEIFKLAL